MSEAADRPAEIHFAYDPAQKDGDISCLALRRGKKILAVLYGPEADTVADYIDTLLTKVRAQAEQIARLEGQRLKNWSIELIEGGTTLAVMHLPSSSAIMVAENNDRIAADMLWMLGTDLLKALQETGE